MTNHPSRTWRARMPAQWYIMDHEGRYHTGADQWSDNRSDAKLYARRWLVVAVRHAVGGYIYRAAQ